MNAISLVKLMFFTGSAAAVFASLPAFADNNNCTSINLRDGTYTPLPKYTEFVVPPVDTNQDGYYETVLKITLEPAHNSDAKEGTGRNDHYGLNTVKFSVIYDGVPAGNSVNIGDSSTNDGGSGDAGTQSNDAEMQIGRQGNTTSGLTPDSTMWVFGHDGFPIDPLYGPTIAIVPQFVKQGDTITLKVADERLAYSNPAIPLSGNLESSWLYALNGQPDTEGPVNYDIFASFNRVIYNPSNSRLGQGVGQVRVCVNGGEKMYRQGGE